MKKILISDQKHARDNTQYFYPYIVISRKDIADTNVNEVADVLLDGTDTEILDAFPKATKAYLPNSIDFLADVDTINKALAQRVPYETPRPSFNIDDNYITGDSLSNCPPPFNEDDYVQNEIPLSEQIAILQPMIDGKKVGAGSIAELTEQLIDLCQNNDLFARDTITGLYRTVFARRPLIPEHQAETIFETHFCDKLAIKTTAFSTDKTTGETVKSTKYRDIRPQELKLLWRNIGLYSTFNSRKEFFDSIPEWDGEERIATFMKKYFECDTNPNFFLLLMTSIVAKFSPRNDYCPYFFDIVSKSKGIGKSFLCRRLIPSKYCGFLTMATRSKDDFYVNAYDGNNVIVVDDECTWVGKGVGKIDMEQFKTLVTNPQDKFSRKFQDPELHDRSFIIVRTCNDVNQVYATNERRQIIFECHLKEQECRIKSEDLPDSFFEQMLAEAKAYYIKNGGIYKLTDDDKLEVKENNLNNYNWETPENYVILGYIQAVRQEPDKWGVKPVAQKFHNRRWGSHKNYCEYCDMRHKTPLQSRAFWRAVSALCELPETCADVISDQKYALEDGGHARIFAVNPLPLTAEEQAIADTEDVPY